MPVGGGWPDQLTAFNDRTVRAVAVRPGDGAIVFAADHDGDEFHQLFEIPPSGGWPEQLTDAPQVQHFVDRDSWSPDGMAITFAGTSVCRSSDADGCYWWWPYEIKLVRVDGTLPASVPGSGDNYSDVDPSWRR